MRRRHCNYETEHTISPHHGKLALSQPHGYSISYLASGGHSISTKILLQTMIFHINQERLLSSHSHPIVKKVVKYRIHKEAMGIKQCLQPGSNCGVTHDMRHEDDILIVSPCIISFYTNIYWMKARTRYQYIQHALTIEAYCPILHHSYTTYSTPNM